MHEHATAYESHTESGVFWIETPVETHVEPRSAGRLNFGAEMSVSGERCPSFFTTSRVYSP